MHEVQVCFRLQGKICGQGTQVLGVKVMSENGQMFFLLQILLMDNEHC